MTGQRSLKLIIPATIVFAFSLGIYAAPHVVFRVASDLWGSLYNLPRTPANPSKYPRGNGGGSADRVRHWNEIAINASGLDHTPVAPGENRVFGEQVGPVRASRVMAIVHIAVFDAVNAIAGGYKSYTGVGPANPGTSMNCSVAQAAHDTLCARIPSQKPTFTAQLATELTQVPTGRPNSDGAALGRQTASAILELRANDGSGTVEPRVGIDF